MIPVREFDNAFDIIAHAKACRERIKTARAKPLPVAPTIIKPSRRRARRAIAMRTIYEAPIGPSRGRDILMVASAPSLKTGAEIIKEVRAKYGVFPHEITGQRRQVHLVLARQEIYYRMRTETKLSFPAIGRMLCRDHSSVLMGANRYAELLAKGEVRL